MKNILFTLNQILNRKGGWGTCPVAPPPQVRSCYFYILSKYDRLNHVNFIFVFISDYLKGLLERSLLGTTRIRTICFRRWRCQDSGGSRILQIQSLGSQGSSDPDPLTLSNDIKGTVNVFLSDVFMSDSCPFLSNNEKESFYLKGLNSISILFFLCCINTQVSFIEFYK